MVSDSGSQVSVSGPGFRVSGSEFRVSSFGFRIYTRNLGYRVVILYLGGGRTDDELHPRASRARLLDILHAHLEPV